MTKVYISLGTNLGNKEINLERAINQMTQRIGPLKKKSSIYSSAPWGFSSLNAFYNQVIEIETSKSAAQLITILLEIETAMGRERNDNSYTDRIIDLDILFYGNEIINLKQLIIPHPKLHLRNFILEPMNEIYSAFIHPTFSLTINQLLVNSKDEIIAYKK